MPTVVRAWQGDITRLASCYRARLGPAERHGLRSIAFPRISTGIYGFPKDEAVAVAVREVRARLASAADRFDEVVFRCFGADDLQCYEEHLKWPDVPYS